MDVPTIGAPAPATKAAAPAGRPDPLRPDPLREAATRFEAVFLAEMFAHAGLGAAQQANGGGPGEEAFSGMLAREWAESVAKQGGIGLSERIYQALLTREGGDA